MTQRKRSELSECEDDVLCGVNLAENDDPAEMSALEKKHVPVIAAPDSVKEGECFQVTVEVGKYKDHPNETDHFIDFVELYADHTYLGRAHFRPVTTCPTVTFCVQLEHIHQKLRAFEHCNRHGTWESDHEITVTE
ncbi:MAG: class II SORL domain-containing protein [Planctomycetota bacterium]